MTQNTSTLSKVSSQVDSLLIEILPIPSAVTRPERFSADNATNADCSGHCSSGICKNHY